MNGITLLVLFGCCLFVHIRGLTLSDSACYGTNPDCDYYTLSCNSSNDVIRLLDLRVGYKPQTECMPATHCNHSDTCCIQAAGDEVSPFNVKNTFDAYANCSGKNECVNVQAPWQLINGSALPSTYVVMEYTCIPDANILNFCGSTTDNSPVTRAGNSVEMKFDSRKQNTSATYRKDCKCTVTSSGGSPLNVSMTLIDLRLHSYETKGNESQQYECSSSNMTSYMYTGSCVNSTSHHNVNFRYNDMFVWEITSESDIVLYDLYSKGRLDSPAMVWLAVEAIDTARDVSVSCNEVYPDVTSTQATPSSTTPSTPPPTTEHVTSTSPSTSMRTTQFADAIRAEDNDDEKTTLFMAIFIPVGCLILLACLVIIVSRCRRHKKRQKRLRYLSQGNGTGSYRDAFILDKFIIDITKQDVDATTPAVLGGEKDVDSRVSYNPVYEVDDEPTPAKVPIESVSATVPQPVITGNSLSRMMEKSQFSHEQRLSNTVRISINPGEDHTRNGITLGKANEEPLQVSHTKQGDEVINKAQNSGNLKVKTIDDDSVIGVRKDTGTLANDDRAKHTNVAKTPQDTIKTTQMGNDEKHNKSTLENGNKNPAMGINNKAKGERNESSDNSVQTKQAPHQSNEKRHEILASPNGGVVIRIGTAPAKHSPNISAPSSEPAVIVPEVIEERRSATAIILPAHSKGDDSSVLFVNNPVKKYL